MPKTPDYFPGTRYEDSIVFLSGTTLPSNSGEIIYVSSSPSGSGFFVDELGVIKHLLAPTLSGGTGIRFVTDSIGNNVTASIDNSVVATLSGSNFFGPVTATGGLTGSLQKTTTGLSYLVAGANVSITSASNGQVVIAAGSSSSGQTTTAPTAPTSNQLGEVFLATLTGSVYQKSLPITTQNGWLVNNFGMMLVTTSSLDPNYLTAGTVYISGSGADVSASYILIGTTSSLPNRRVLAPSTGILLTDLGAANNVTVGVNNNVVAMVSGTRFTGPVLAGILSGSLQQLTGGLSYLVAGNNVTITSQSNGQVVISAAVTGGGSSGADVSASYVTVGNTGSLPNERALAAGVGINITDSGANKEVTFDINDGIVATLSGSVFNGPVVAPAGLTGSLQQVGSGLSYLVAGVGTTIASQSNGQVVVGVNNNVVATLSGSIFTGVLSASAGLSGSLQQVGPGLAYLKAGQNIIILSQSNGQILLSTVPLADPNASFLVLSSTGSLANERVFTTSGSALSMVDNGSTVTLDLATTGTQGVYGSPFAVNSRGQVTSGSTSWFGQNFQFVTGVLPVNNTNNALITGLSMTGSGLTSGIYRLGWSYLYRCNSVASSFVSKIFIGTTSSFAVHHQPSSAAVDELDVHSGFTYLRITGSVQTFDLQFQLSAKVTNVTASLYDRSFELWRVS